MYRSQDYVQYMYKYKEIDIRFALIFTEKDVSWFFQLILLPITVILTMITAFEVPANRGVSRSHFHRCWTRQRHCQRRDGQHIRPAVKRVWYLRKQVYRILLPHDCFLEENIGVARSFFCEVRFACEGDSLWEENRFARVCNRCHVTTKLAPSTWLFCAVSA